MNRADLEIHTEPSRVFGVLADGWSYPNWVVGVTHVRGVDDRWPAVGARLHHTLGLWPLVGENTAEVVEMEPDRRLVIRIRLGRLGSTRVELRIRPAAGGSHVELLEHGDSGVVGAVPRVVADRVIRARNAESLRRLRTVAETRAPATA